MVVVDGGEWWWWVVVVGGDGWWMVVSGGGWWVVVSTIKRTSLTPFHVFVLEFQTFNQWCTMVKVYSNE